MSDISGRLEEIIDKLDNRIDSEDRPSHNYGITIADRIDHISKQIDLLPTYEDVDVPAEIKKSYKTVTVNGSIASGGVFSTDSMPFDYSRHIVLFARIRNVPAIVLPYVNSNNSTYTFKVIDPSTFKPFGETSSVVLEVILVNR